MRARDGVCSFMVEPFIQQKNCFWATAAASICIQQQARLARELQWLRVLQWRLAAFVFWESLRVPAGNRGDGVLWSQPATRRRRRDARTLALLCPVG